MKILTKEEEQAHYEATIIGGLYGGAAGVAVGSLGVWAASSRYPAFRGLTLPFRAFIIVSAGTFSSIVAADSSSRRHEASRQPERNYQDEQQQLKSEVDAQKSSTQKTKEWLADNRYSIVFGSWVASMAGALGIVGQNKYLTTQQKIVQARVYAQGFTIAAVILSLAFEGGDRFSGKNRWETVKIIDPDDPNHKHLIEKKIHHERYAGEDQWMDMVEAEEKRMKERHDALKEYVKKDFENQTRQGKYAAQRRHDTEWGRHEKKLDEAEPEKGKPEESKSNSLNAP